MTGTGTTGAGRACTRAAGAAGAFIPWPQHEVTEHRHPAGAQGAAGGAQGRKRIVQQGKNTLAHYAVAGVCGKRWALKISHYKAAIITL